MSVFAALDVSQELTAVCVVNQEGSIIAEAKVATCPDAITAYLECWSDELERVGMETGPLAVWLWNTLVARGLPIICLDARHANGVLKMMPNKTDRHDARGLAQIVRTGWYKAVQIKSHEAYVTRALLTARDALVGMRVRLENEVRGLLKTFGVMFGKRVGGFKRRAEEIISGDLSVAPELVPIFEALIKARRDILARIKALDSQIRTVVRRHKPVQLLMTAPGVGPITALAVFAAFDDANRFKRSSSAGAYLGLTPRRYESGEISRNGRVSKQGDKFVRSCLFEAANAIYCRNLGGSRLRDWAHSIAQRTGPRKAKVALARKLAVTLHAMWRTGSVFKDTSSTANTLKDTAMA
ncbi:IS110 family transposase [Devosia sp.]|uniref:IS110 family transposase n=1 Tax=Devosia sp. TaxID=1871048 RepID=UPI0037C0E815